MAFMGQEIVRKQQRHNLSWGMYTLIAVFVHFNYFIDDLASSLASSRLLRFWVPCGTTGPFNKTFTSVLYEDTSLFRV